MATSDINFYSSKSPTKSKCPTYPKAYDDWVLKQSISPRKILERSQYFEDHKQCTFAPKINDKSVKMSKRDPNAKVQDYMIGYLYQDALNRSEKTSNQNKKLNEEIIM